MHLNGKISEKLIFLKTVDAQVIILFFDMFNLMKQWL